MKNSWVRARVLEASDRSYSGAVLPLLEQAEKEIAISLYLLEPNDTAGPYHPVNRLLESLLKARGRGVRVRLYLNTKFSVRSKTEVALGKYFERLLHAGVEITSLLPHTRLHDKLIVIDGRYVIEGSTNWSVSALESNYESDSVIDSPGHARKKLERINRLTLPPLPKEKKIDRPLSPLPETVEFPLAIFEKKLLPRMIADSDGRAMDLYLMLLGQAGARGKNEVELDLETAGRSLGLPSSWERSRTRRQMIKVLRKLEKRYGLIEAEFPYGRDARIRLEEFAGERIPMPGWIFSPDFLSRESSGAVFLALAGELLKREGVEIDLLSAPEIEKRFGISRSAVVRTRAEMKLK